MYFKFLLFIKKINGIKKIKNVFNPYTDKSAKYTTLHNLKITDTRLSLIVSREQTIIG